MEDVRVYNPNKKSESSAMRSTFHLKTLFCKSLEDFYDFKIIRFSFLLFIRMADKNFTITYSYSLCSRYLSGIRSAFVHFFVCDL